jgi:hypothetical protein
MIRPQGPGLGSGPCGLAGVRGLTPATQDSPFGRLGPAALRPCGQGCSLKAYFVKKARINEYVRPGQPTAADKSENDFPNLGCRQPASRITSASALRISFCLRPGPGALAN